MQKNTIRLKYFTKYYKWSALFSSHHIKGPIIRRWQNEPDSEVRLTISWEFCLLVLLARRTQGSWAGTPVQWNSQKTVNKIFCTITFCHLVCALWSYTWKRRGGEENNAMKSVQTPVPLYGGKFLGVHATKKPWWHLHGIHVFIQTGTNVVLCS